jgi:hypothetical protein
MKIAIRLLGAAAVLAAIGLAVASVSAAPITSSGRPLAPALGYAARYNTHLLVWAEDRGQGTGLDLYAARVTESGIVVGAEIPLVVAAGDQSDPALAFNERVGDFLVVFTHSGGPGSTPTAGVPIPGTPGAGTPPALPSPPGPPLANQTFVKIGALRAAAAHAAAPYSSPPPIPTGVQTPGQPPPPGTQPPLPTPGGTGTAPSTSLPPPATVTTMPGQPTVTPVPGAATATSAVPQPPSSAPGSRDIYGIWTAPNGFAVTSAFPIIASPADDTYPGIAYRAQPSLDQWVLVWRDVTGIAVSLKTVELAGFGRSMAFASATNNIVTGADHGRPSIAAGASGEFLVAWSQKATGRVDRNVVARRLNANAFPYGAFLNLVDAVADETYPSVGAQFDTGDYLVAWEERVPGNAPDIRVRRLNRNGIPLRAAYDIAGGGPFSFAPSLPSTDTPTLLLAWVDRNPASDHSIMGAEITRDGRRLGPERVLVAGGAGPAGVTPLPPPPGFPTSPPIPPPPIP